MILELVWTQAPKLHPIRWLAEVGDESIEPSAPAPLPSQYVNIPVSEAEIAEAVDEAIAALDIDKAVVTTFSYGDATPHLLASLESGAFVADATVKIETGFDGAGAEISIGTLGDPNSIFPSTSIMPYETGVYASAVSLLLNAPTDIYLFITPGAGAAAGAGNLCITVN